MSNPLVELQKLGQSIWYDNIRRSMLDGDLQAKIADDDLRGVTSNPAIFEKAIAGSTDYNEALAELARKGKSTAEIYEIMAVEDIQKAADILHPVCRRSGGTDGYISFEVSPELAHDTDGTIRDAKRLWAWIDRPNVMIKIPATPEGLPAIEEVIAAGINVNVTLIFAKAAYLEVADRYLKGLERRVAAGLAIAHIASVASFFVSRIDSSVDNELEFKIRRSSDSAANEKMSSLLGKIAIANAKDSYQEYLRLFKAERFLALPGARPQRMLWASTGAKNPNYRDVVYMEELIGSETVNTVPPATYTAFRDHGEVRGQTLIADVDEARQALADLAASGISLDKHTSKLLTAAVKAFIDPFKSLFKVIDGKRDEACECIVQRQRAFLGDSAESVEAALDRMEQESWTRRIWRKDASLWKEDAASAEIIRNALGWLSVPEVLLAHAEELQSFAARVVADGFEFVVLLGMGGSSLCPEVLRRTFGRREGFPALLVLDSTDPTTILHLEGSIDLAKTLFIVASKSGSTTEPLMLQQYFFDRVRQSMGDRAGRNFVAITDPGSKLEAIARADNYRRIFINMADIGGRYSALSYFGMVPAALAGIDVKELLDRAFRASQACERTVPIKDNPGARLGGILGVLARDGRDKVTFVIPPPIDSLGLWIEQLVAESTGKEGISILPVAGEPLGSPDQYGSDRVFAYVCTEASSDSVLEAGLDALEAAGHPVIRHLIQDELSLGREFFLWEFGVAVAGAILGINPFDQPNVQESKDNTKALLEQYTREGSLPGLHQIGESGGCSISCDSAAAAALSGPSLDKIVAQHLGRVRAGDYVALTAYIPEDPETDQALEAIRCQIRDSLGTATTVGYGPRFLHSTGQLHKGGGDNGVFIQITTDDQGDLAIPGEVFSFGLLKQAQALGDFQSLASRGRRAINFHIEGEVGAGLARLQQIVEKVVATA